MGLHTQEMLQARKYLEVLGYAGTGQLATLDPTVVIFKFSSYIFNAFDMATTTVFAWACT
jgi:hypothetical protein